MTMSIFINRFLNELRRSGKSPNTLSAYAGDLKQFNELLNKTSVDQVSSADVLGFKRHIGSLTPNTQARKLLSVKKFLYWAYQKGHINENLMTVVAFPSRGSAAPVRPLSVSQIARLRRVATPIERLLLELVLQTGIRLRDVVELRSKHLSDRTITIPSSGVKLPIARPLRKALATYELVRPFGERSAVLSNTQGRPLSVRSATTMLRTLARRAGVRGATARNLRTTFIVKQLEAGIPFPTIQHMTGLQTLGSLSMYRRLAVRQAKPSPIAIAEI